MTLLLLSLACRTKDVAPIVDSSPPDEVLVDADGDGVDETLDCDDTNSSVYPGNAETPYNGVDDDCDETTPDDDLDEDGFVAADDCDDADPAVNPDAVESCNDLDDDCNGAIDDAVGDSWYPDVDGDGYGDAALGVVSCDCATGYVADATDCDDRDADVNPGASELCNEVDDDCDGDVDEDVEETFYADADGDGAGDPGVSTLGCEPSAGFVDNDDDCDDTDAAVGPNATEVCNEIDDDCDGTIDEDDAADAPTWYEDADGDAYGNPDSTSVSCEADAGWVGNDDDCDDTYADLNPDTTWWVDSDGDGYGNPDISVQSCEQPSSFVDDDSDCDDADAELNPDTVWYEDADSDGYGDSASTTAQCEQPSGYTADATDCDDDADDVNPGADEECDTTDHDCDGDDGLSSCEDCEALLTADPTKTDGVYEIDLDGAGGDDPFDVYCDMTLDGGGWTLWWWFEAGSSLSGVTDVLDGDIWDCDPSSDTQCQASIPVTSPDELLVLNQTGDWAVWEFDSTTTAGNALAAFTTGTTTGRSSSTACNDAWEPVAQSGTMTDDPYVCDENNNADPGCDCFWYDSYSGVYSFYLDDDTGWAETAFAGGYDNSGSLGVDSLETSYRYNNESTHDLWMYWR